MSDFYALVPAAGSGSRMGGELPKQYLDLAGKPMIYHALTTLCTSPEINTVFVVLAPDDEHFKNFDWSHCGEKLEPLYCGGATRAESVTNGLMAAELEPDEWVLVHDAARPCLSKAQLARLIIEVRDDEVGGILAVPVADTLKRADARRRIVQTEDRNGLWQAQTPQMFRTGLLLQALNQTRDVTDEASAIEAMGLHPRLVESETTDIRMAELILRERT
jgi:2-C-methyl-D-erythritol 4-phosphate cytidylyltransferase